MSDAAMSDFDPDLFLSTTYEEANATTVVPIPDGDYQAVIESIAAKAPKEGMRILEVVWNLVEEDPTVSELMTNMGRDKLTARQTIWLDINGDGSIDMGEGRNIQLGRLRKAINMNESGRPWQPRDMEGAGPCTIKVITEPDKNDSEKLWNRVVRVAKAA